MLCSAPLLMRSPSQTHVGPRMSAVHALRPQARALRTLLKMQCQDGLMHESVHVDDLGQCSRKWFEVGRVVAVTARGTLLLGQIACVCSCALNVAGGVRWAPGRAKLASKAS